VRLRNTVLIEEEKVQPEQSRRSHNNTTNLFEEITENSRRQKFL